MFDGNPVLVYMAHIFRLHKAVLTALTIVVCAGIVMTPTGAASQDAAAEGAAAYDSVRLNGISLAFRDIGAGEPVVLLHGFMASGLMWDRSGITDALSARYRLIIPDLRGRGRSLDPTGDFTPQRAAEDVLALLDHLGIERAHMIGVSGGALSLLHIATGDPERVNAMILISGGHYLAAEARDRIRRDPRVEDMPEAVLERLVAMHEHVGGVAQAREIIRAYQSAPDDYDVINFTPPYLSTITARTLIVHGDRDELFPLPVAIEMYESIPDAQLWILPGMGHESLWQAPEWLERFRAASVAFLSESVGGSQ